VTRFNKQQWRKLNIILITLGLFLPWIMFYFDVHVAGEKFTPQTGWEFFYYLWWEIIDSILVSEVDIILLLPILIGLCGALIPLYLIYSIAGVLSSRVHKQNKSISIILVLIIVILLFPVIAGGTPFLGFWISNIGVLSSTILEWQV